MDKVKRQVAESLEEERNSRGREGKRNEIGLENHWEIIEFCCVFCTSMIRFFLNTSEQPTVGMFFFQFSSANDLMREEGEEEDPVNGGGEWVLKTVNHNGKEEKPTDFAEGTSKLQAFSNCGGVVPNKIMVKLDEVLLFIFVFPAFLYTR